jgi:drug/metabolite transporter (DMT)-like permease
VIICGLCPVATVCTGLALSAPVAGLIRNTETVLALALAWHLPLLPLGLRHCVPVVT